MICVKNGPKTAPKGSTGGPWGAPGLCRPPQWLTDCGQPIQERRIAPTPNQGTICFQTQDVVHVQKQDVDLVMMMFQDS